MSSSLSGLPQKKWLAISLALVWVLTSSCGVKIGSMGSSSVSSGAGNGTVPQPGPEESTPENGERPTGTGDAARNISTARSLVVTDSDFLVANGTHFATITVTVKDGQGAPLARRKVQLRSNRNESDNISQAQGSTDDTGTVSFRVKSLVPGTATYRATVDSVPLSEYASVTFNTWEVKKLAFVAQPSGAVAGRALATAPLIELQDDDGNRVTAGPAASGEVTISRQSGTGNLMGSVTVTASEGRASFAGSGLKFDLAGSKVLRATKANSSGQIISVDSAPFVVAADAVSAANSSINLSSAQIKANGTESTNVIITLKDAFGNPVPGIIPQFSVSGAGNTVTQPNSATDTSGTAIGTFKSTVVGTKTISISSPAGLTALTATVNVIPGNMESGQSLVTVSPPSVVANGSASSSVKVALKDVSGNAIPGKNVTIGSDRGSYDSISPLSATSDSNGEAIFSVRSTRAGVSVYTAVNASDNVTVSATGTITFIPGAPSAAQSNISASPTTMVADGNSTSTVTVRLKDANGNVTPGINVSLGSSRGSNDSFSPASATTNSSGEASFAVTSLLPGNVSFTAKDGGGTAIAQGGQLTFTPIPVSASESRLSASPTSLPVGGAISTITVTLKDADGNLLSGRSVALSSTRPNDDTISPASTTTAQNGTASFTVSSNLAGTSTFTASASGVTIAQQSAVTFLPAAAKIVFTRQPVPGLAGQTFLTQPIVEIQDAAGNRITSGPDATANISLQIEGTAGLQGTTTKSAVAGVADFSSAGLRFDVAGGTRTLRATKAATSGGTGQMIANSQTFSVSPADPSTTQSTFSVSPTSVPADGSTSATISVTLRDDFSNVIPSRNVTFNVTGAAHTLVQPSAPTDSSGQASGSIRASTTGVRSIKITSPSELSSLSRTVDFTAGTVSAATSTVSAGLTSLAADGATSTTITVTLKDAGGNVLPNQAVTLGSTRPTNDTISPATATTNPSGVASFTVFSNAAGSSVFSASAGVTISQTATITFTAVAARIVFTRQPSNGTAGQALTTQPIVEVQDALGNRITSGSDATASISFEIVGVSSPGLQGVSFKNATNGSADFTGAGLRIDSAGTRILRATKGGTGTMTVDSQPITISPAAPAAAQSTFSVSPTSLVANNSSTALISLTVRDAYSNVIPGVAVAFNSTLFGQNLVQPTGNTNSGGQVSGSISASAAGTRSIGIIFPAELTSLKQNVEFIPGPVSPTTSTVRVNPSSVPADGITTAAVDVSLTDAQGNPVAGKAVTLSSSRGSNDTISILIGTTGSDGLARFTIKSQLAGNTALSALDTTDNIAVANGMVLGFTADPTAVSPSTSTVSASPTSVTADGTATTSVIVTLKNSLGNPVSGKPVQLTSDRGISVDGITAVQSMSDSSGVAQFTVKSQVAGTAILSATASPSIAITQTAAVNFVPGPVSPSHGNIQASPTSIVADGNASATVTATVKDFWGNPISGVPVALSSSAASGDTITPASVTTNVVGQAAFTIKSVSVGSRNFTARHASTSAILVQGGGLATTAPAPASASASASTSNSQVSASPTSIPAGETSTVTVTLKDASGNLLSGRTVTLSSSDPFDLFTPSATTNANGVASFTVSRGSVGTSTYTAASSGVTISQTASVTYTTPAPAPLKLTATALSRAAKLTWNSADSSVAGYLLVRRAGSEVSFTPANGTLYTYPTTIGDQTIVYVYKWDPLDWSEIQGSNDFTDTDLTAGTTYHYALFSYDQARNYSAPLTASVSPLIELPVTNGVVRALAAHGNTLYLGGQFDRIGTPTGSGVLVESSFGRQPGGVSWPSINGAVYAAIPHPSNTGQHYIAGTFTKVGGEPAIRLARIKANGTLDTGWTAQANGLVRSISAYNGVLYLAGDFTEVNGTARNALAAVSLANGSLTSWDPNWTPFPPDGVYHILANANGVYAGDNFGLWAFDPEDGSTLWSKPTDDGGGGKVLAMAFASYGTTLYVGGSFTELGDEPRASLAAVDSVTGNVLAWAPETNGHVYALATWAGLVYVGGKFSSLNDQPRFGAGAVSEVGGVLNNWAPPIGGSPSYVTALAVSNVDSSVYVGGEFGTADSVVPNHIIKVDAAYSAVTNTTATRTQWLTRTNAQVRAISVGTGVFIGGDFSLVGGQSTSNLAAIDLTTGNLVYAPAVSGTVYCLAISATHGLLYVGGQFSTIAITNSRQNLAAVNLSNGTVKTDWSADANSPVYALAFNGVLYAGGFFNQIKGQNTRFAALDPQTGQVQSGWQVQIDFSSPISSIAATTGGIYVAGTFSSINSKSRFGTAKFNANGTLDDTWKPYANTQPTAVGATSDAVYLGGGFTTINGTNVPWNFAAVDPNSGAPNLGFQAWDSRHANQIVVDGQRIYVAARSGLHAFDKTNGKRQSSWAYGQYGSSTPQEWGPTGFPNAVIVVGDKVIIGGSFTRVASSYRRGLGILSRAP